MQTGCCSLMLITVVLGTVRAADYLSEKPSHLTPCFTTDAGFNKCFAKNFQSLFKEWKDGVPGLKNVGSLDPLSVKRIKISQHTGTILALHMDLKNITARGASGTIAQEARLDKGTMITYQKYLVPKLSFDSDFRAKGLVLGLNINGHGTAQFQTENALAAIICGMKIRREHGHTFTDVVSFKVEIKQLDGFKLQVHNLFGGNQILEDSANELFNSNWRDVYPLLKPVIEQTLEGVFLDRLKRIFAYVPGDYFVGDLPEV